MPYTNKACYLLHDYNSKSNLQTINYFRQTTKHYQIWLVIISCYIDSKSKCCSLELIKKKTNNISLKTIATIVKDAEKLNYLTKVKSETDSRTKNILPTSQTIKEFKTWIDTLKKNLSSFKD